MAAISVAAVRLCLTRCVNARVLVAALLAVGLGAAAARAGSVSQNLKKPDAWFASDEAARVTANILSYQSGVGGWPKNTDTAAKPYAGDPAALRPTFDNGATTDELRFLARRFNAAGDARCRDAFAKGLAYILAAQYPTGGWPQFYPPGKQYHRHITFNDKDRVVVSDPAAPPLWARFYEIGTDQPIFCDRDGVAKHSLAEIDTERRNGYAWLGTWPRDVLDKEYPAWKRRL